MKISVIMIDGSFRENVYGAKYFSEQDFPDNEYEVIWVEYFSKANADVYKNKKVKIITLNRTGTYHSSYCFNRGIKKAKGEILVIPDADQIVKPDFLKKVYNIHKKYEKLVVYGYRYDELTNGVLKSLNFDELDKKTILKNPLNYGGCLSVRKKWLIKINGYEQHPLFGTGNHANGLDIYTRFKNFGLAIMWSPELKLYHPWHPFTLMYTKEHEIQKRIIEWRNKNLQWLAIKGIDETKNIRVPEELNTIINKGYSELTEIEKGKMVEKKFLKTYNQGIKYKNENNPLWRNKIEEALNILKESKIESEIFEYRIGSIYKLLGDTESSEKIFMKLYRMFDKTKNKEGILFHLGEIYYIKGKLSKSREFFSELIKLNPEHLKANYYLKKISQGKK